MYNRKTLFADFLTDLKTFGGCGEAITWCEKIDASKPEMTFGEAVDALILDSKTDQSWAMGTLMIYDGRLDGDLRKGLIKKISDPMTAFTLYTNLKTLDDIDERMLIKIYKGKLPRAEEELKSGKVKRKKK